MGRIQVNVQATPSASSINGQIAQYLKDRFGRGYGTAYIDAARLFWKPIVLQALGAHPDKVKAAKEECEREWRSHWDSEENVDVSEDFDDLIDED